MDIEPEVDDRLIFNIPNSKKEAVDLAEITGGDGFWHRRIFAITFFLQAPCAFNVFFMSFCAPNLDHWCARPPEARNLSVEQWRSLAMPPYDQHCSRYEYINLTIIQNHTTNFSGDAVIPCEAWEYDTTFYHSSVLSKFNLVCDRKWLVSLSRSVFMAGMSSSLVVFSHLSDRIGRKPVTIVCGFIAIISSVISAFADSFVTFLIARYFIALAVTMFLYAPFILLMEVVSPRYRNKYGIGTGLGWALGCVTLPLIAWLIRDFTYIQLAITLPCLLVLAMGWIPESPRWLLNHGKTQEANDILLTAAEINGVKHSAEDKEVLKALLTKGTESYKAGGSKGTVLDLLKPGLWQITLNVCFNLFAVAFVYYGLSLNTNELAGDPFVNFALLAVVEIPSALLLLIVVDSIGKRKLQAVCMVISGISCVVCYIIPSNISWLVITMYLIGKSAIAAAFHIVFIFSSELFPTAIRNIGMGTASLCGRLGSILAPFMRELGYATHPVFPQILFGILAISSGLLVILLPETQNCSIPDTVKDATEFSRRKNSELSKKKKESCIMVRLTEGETNNEQDGANLLITKNTTSV